MQYTVYREIFVSILLLPLSPSLSVGEFKTGQIENNFLITVLIRKNIYNILCLGHLKMGQNHLQV